MLGQIVDHIFGQVFNQIFGQGFGEGKKHKYSVQYYLALGKNVKNSKTHLRPPPFLFLRANFSNPTFKLVNILDFFMNLLQNLAIHSVFYKESESQVKKCQISEPGGKN